MKKLSRNEALRLTKKLIKSNQVVLTQHCRDMMKERHFNIQDALHAINNGTIRSEPEPHIKTGRWVYSISGMTLDKTALEIVVDIYEEEGRIVIITGITK